MIKIMKEKWVEGIKMKKTKVLAALLGSALLMATGCNSQNSQVKQETLNLSVAASLTDCMDEMQKAFEKENPNIKLQFNFGGSGTLQKQIEQGAPVDLFFSAGMKQMKALEEEGLMEDNSVEEILANRLVLIVPKSAENQSLTFETLGKANLDKMAVGEVGSVPVGQYTMEVFDHLGITQQLDPKIVYAKDVREVLTWVETGNVDAGVVYETDAKLSDQVVVCDVADEVWHTPVSYPIGIVKGTKYQEATEAFLKFIKSDEGKAIFEKYGFATKF